MLLLFFGDVFLVLGQGKPEYLIVFLIHNNKVQLLLLTQLDLDLYIFTERAEHLAFDDTQPHVELEQAGENYANVSTSTIPTLTDRDHRRHRQYAWLPADRFCHSVL